MTLGRTAGGGVLALCCSCRGGRVIGTGAGLLLSAGRGTGGSGADSGAGVALLVACWRWRGGRGRACVAAGGGLLLACCWRAGRGGGWWWPDAAWRISKALLVTALQHGATPQDYTQNPPYGRRPEIFWAEFQFQNQPACQDSVSILL